MTGTQAPAGWYPDPAGDTTKLRYWDGTQWTEQMQPVNAEAPATGQAMPAQAETPVQTATPAQAIPDQAATPAQVTPTYAQAQPVNQNAYTSQPMQPQAAPVKDKSNLAIAALVLGIASPFAAFIALFGYICGILAIVFGVKSLKSSRRTMAIVGIILGIVGILAAIGSSILGVMSMMALSNYYYY